VLDAIIDRTSWLQVWQAIYKLLSWNNEQTSPMYLYRMRYRNSLLILILTVTSVSFGLHLHTQADIRCSLKALQTTYSLMRLAHMTNVIHSSYSFTNLHMLSSSFVSCRCSGVKNRVKGPASKCICDNRKRLISSRSSGEREGDSSFDSRTAVQSCIEVNTSAHRTQSRKRLRPTERQVARTELNLRPLV